MLFQLKESIFPFFCLFLWSSSLSTLQTIEELTGGLDTAPLRAIPLALWKRMENEEGAAGSEKATLSQGARMSQASRWAHGSEHQEDVCRQLPLGEGFLLHVLCLRHKSQFFLKPQSHVLPSTLHAKPHSAVLRPPIPVAISGCRGLTLGLRHSL